MSRGLSLSGKLQEEIMEQICIYKRTIEDSEKILTALSENERLDHENDLVRAQVFTHLEEVKTYLQLKQYDMAEPVLSLAIKKLHLQEKIDNQDDVPRMEIKTLVNNLRQKAFENKDLLFKIMGEITGKGLSDSKPEEVINHE